MRWRRGVPAPLPVDPDCEHVGAVLQAYLDGELGPADAEAVAGHLRFCERCGIEATTVRQVIDAIQRQRPDLGTGPLDRLSGYVDELTRGGPPLDD